MWTGLFLLIIGGLLLAREAGVLFPAWFFSWPVLLIGFGLFIGAKHGFRSWGWIVPILIGGVFLYDKINPEINFRPYLWPIIFIALGLVFILKPRRSYHCWKDADGKWQKATIADNTTTDPSDFTTDRRDFVDTTSVFGGVKKNVLTKSFKGGDIVNFMGGSEINLTQADFNGRIKIDATNIFGGTKLIVPPNWDVQSEVVAIFGGVDDKRQLNGDAMDPNKVLILDGTCLFGGIEIRSF